MTTKIEWAAQIKKAGLELPENWGKLSTSRAEAAKDRLLGNATKSVASIIGAGLGRMAGVVLAAAGDMISTDKSEPKSRGQTKPATMPKDLNWRRRTKGSSRGWYIVRELAADPEPVTRQVRRQNERREQKMPIGARQEIWHKTMGFGKIGKGKRRAA